MPVSFGCGGAALDSLNSETRCDQVAAAGAGGGGGDVAGRTGDVVPEIGGAIQEMRVAFERECGGRRGLDGAGEPEVMQVLQAVQIHVSVEKVVGREEILE